MLKLSDLKDLDPDRVIHVFDTETHGLQQAIDPIRSIAVVSGTLRHGIHHKLRLLIHTGKTSNPEAYAVHKIPDDQNGGMPFTTAMNIMDLVIGTDTTDNAIIIAQNIGFDLNMIAADSKRNKMLVPIWATQKHRHTDTMLLAKEKMPELSSYRLDNLLKHLNVKTENNRSQRHDALEDCQLTFEVFKALVLTQQGSLLDDTPTPNQPTATPQTSENKAVPPQNSLPNWLTT